MRARIATVCQSGNFQGSIEGNRKYVFKLLDLALRQKPDLVCLPEAFTTAQVNGKNKEELAETVPGPTTDAVAKRARENSCYIICPIETKRNQKYWNSAIVIDRSGEIFGIYDKIHPVTSSADYTIFEAGITPGKEAFVFDLDFGRVGIQICFDLGFPESWEELSKKGAKMVFWPSAYNGGFPLQVYAALYQYYVISSVCGNKSRIIDPCGTILAETDERMNIIYRDINLDFIVAHYDFNYSIPDNIMKAYPGQVEIRSHLDDAHFLVEPVNDALTIEKLQKEFGFEPVLLYHQRHRVAYKMIHQGKKPQSQKAAHGERFQYSKTE